MHAHGFRCARVRPLCRALKAKLFRRKGESTPLPPEAGAVRARLSAGPALLGAADRESSAVG